MAGAPWRQETVTAGGFDPLALRREFPVFERNPGLVFLDSGASAQKPRQVIDGIAEFYRSDYANVHRGVYQLSQRSTDHFEAAREKMRRFLNAADEREIVFLRGATEAINLVAQSWGPAHLKAGDEIVISDVEHHSNIVPWQMLRDRVGAKLLVAPTDDTGEFDLGAFEAMLSPRTRLVAVTHVSNVTGATLADRAHRRAGARPWSQGGAKVLVDGCQAVPRMPVDVRALGCDFYLFSGHKAYGPTGTGVLYGRYDVLEAMPPWQTGGGMILNVEIDHTDFQDPPHRFEAGTPDIAGAVGHRAGGRFHRGDRPRGDPRPRGGADRLRHRPGLAHSRGPGHPRRAAAAQRVLLQCRGRAPARCRHRARPAQGRGAGRPPLRPAADGEARAGRHGARLARRLQRRDRHRPRSPRRSRPAGRCSSE